MQTLYERDAIGIVKLWCASKCERPAIAVNTIRSIRSRAKRLAAFLDTDKPLDESTIARLLNTSGQYSQLHKLAKTLIGICRWGFENKLLQYDPLVKVKLPYPDFTHRKYWLTKSELSKLESAPLSGRMAEIRDIFLLQCFTGLSYSDVKTITRECVYEVHGYKWLRVSRQKTGKYPIVQLTDKCQQILDRLDWKIRLPCNQVYNRMLKEIQITCQVGKVLHSHIACKTFVQLELERGASLHSTATRRGIAVKTLVEHYGTLNERVLIAEMQQINNQLFIPFDEKPR